LFAALGEQRDPVDTLSSVTGVLRFLDDTLADSLLTRLIEGLDIWDELCHRFPDPSVLGAVLREREYESFERLGLTAGDRDSVVRVIGDNVFAAGFQGRTAMLALDSGQIWWAHDMSSDRGLSVDDDNLFVTQSDGVVVAMRQRDGSEVWRNDKLKRRGLTTPAVTSTAIAVADYQGYLHWLDKATGVLVARQRVAKYRVSNPPVAVKDTVIVLTDSGSLAAFRATPPPKP